MRFRTIFAILSLLGMIACKENSNSTLSNTSNQLVVESFLYPGKRAEISVTNYIHYNTTDEQTEVDHLPVSITTHDSTVFLYYTESGKYISDDSLFLKEGQNIQLRIHMGETDITASTLLPTKPLNFKASATQIQMPDFSSSSGSMPSFPDPIELTWDNPDAAYHLVLVESAETDPEAVSGFGNRGGFRSEPTKSSSARLQSMSFQYYGMNRVILFKINPEYVALYNNNSNSSQNLTNPPTNISNGYGIFTGLNSDTLFVNVVK